MGYVTVTYVSNEICLQHSSCAGAASVYIQSIHHWDPVNGTVRRHFIGRALSTRPPP